MKNVRCKLNVNKITQFSYPPGTGEVELMAIYQSPAQDSADRGNACMENRVFGDATPQATFRMTILNPAAFSTFREALDRQVPFYVDFVPAE